MEHTAYKKNVWFTKCLEIKLTAPVTELVLREIKYGCHTSKTISYNMLQCFTASLKVHVFRPLTADFGEVKTADIHTL